VDEYGKKVNILHLEPLDMGTLHLRPCVDGERRALLLQFSILFWLKRCQRWPWQTHELNISLSHSIIWFLYNLQSQLTINWIVLKLSSIIGKQSLRYIETQGQNEMKLHTVKVRPIPWGNLENKISCHFNSIKWGMNVLVGKGISL